VVHGLRLGRLRGQRTGDGRTIVMKMMRTGALLGVATLCLTSVQGCKGEADAGGSSRQTATVARRAPPARIQATGVVRAMVGAEVRVGSRISGKVEHLYANIGDQVKAGDPIAKIEDTDLRARVARAEAELASARAQLALLQRGARPEEISEAEAILQQAKAELPLATVELERQTRLLAQEMAAQEAADRAQRDLSVTRGRVAAARSRVEFLKHRYLPEEIELAEAQVTLAEAGVAEAQANLGYATISAPISGVVAQVTTQEGETVAAGMSSPTFVTIIDLDRLEVAAYVDEVDIGRVTIGQSATFTVDSFPDVEFTGKVTAVYPRAVIQSNVVNYITTLSIDNSEGRLKPDMTATITIVLDQPNDVPAVPEKALRSEGGKRFVYVVNVVNLVLANGSIPEQEKGKAS